MWDRRTELWEEVHAAPDCRYGDNACYPLTVFETPAQPKHPVIAIGRCELGEPFNICEMLRGDPIHTTWESEDHPDLAHTVPFRRTLRVM